MLAIGLLEAIAFGLDGMPDETSRVIDLLDDIDEKSDKKRKKGISIYSKPVCVINKVPTFKNSKSINLFNINLIQRLKSSDKSYNGSSRINETNCTSSRKNYRK